MKADAGAQCDPEAPGWVLSRIDWTIKTIRSRKHSVGILIYRHNQTGEERETETLDAGELVERRRVRRRRPTRKR